MPTYVCHTSPSRLSLTQKRRVVNAITVAHAEETNVPKYLVQVIFQEVNAEQQYINELAVPADQIWIRGDIRSGRTDEQKEQLIKRMMELSSIACDIDASYFWIYLCDIPKMAEFGSLLPVPGKEGPWSLSLPAEVKKRYQFTE
jgi:phenylpyruvate tautomerase PptA (4-oxalocrotonate tautomerase family)